MTDPRHTQAAPQGPSTLNRSSTSTMAVLLGLFALAVAIWGLELIAYGVGYVYGWLLQEPDVDAWANSHGYLVLLGMLVWLFVSVAGASEQETWKESLLWWIGTTLVALGPILVHWIGKLLSTLGGGTWLMNQSRSGVILALGLWFIGWAAMKAYEKNKVFAVFD